ncbi:coiled-coil domain-containing protein 86 [Pholidichthys leucotaenia]
MPRRTRSMSKEVSSPEDQVPDPPEEVRQTRSGRILRTPAPLESTERSGRTPARRTRRSVLQEMPPTEEEKNTEETEQKPESPTEEITNKCVEPESESEPSSGSDPQPEPCTESEPKPEPCIDSETKSEPITGSEAQIEPCPGSETSIGSEPKSELCPESEPQMEPFTGSAPEGQTEAAEADIADANGTGNSPPSRTAQAETVPASSEPVPKKKKPNPPSGVKQAPAIPLGKPKSGRVWKDRNKQRFSAVVRDKQLCSSWEKKMEAKREKDLMKQFSVRLKEEKARQKEEKRKRREENLKRRAENERKAEIVQVIRNTAKIKRMKKKQLRRIEKRDTLAQLQKSPVNNVKAQKNQRDVKTVPK